MDAVFVYSKSTQEFVGGFSYDGGFPAARVSRLLENVAADLTAQTGETVVAADLTAYRAEDSEAKALFALPASQRTATFDGEGNVTSVQAAAETPRLYVHVDLSGGSTSPSSTLYLKNDGVDALTVAAELRDGPELATSAAVTQIGGQDVTDVWALELVNAETGVIADTPLVQMTAGVINVSYKTTIAPCMVRLDDSRFEMIGPYKVVLAAPVEFKIVRELS